MVSFHYFITLLGACHIFTCSILFLFQIDWMKFSPPHRGNMSTHTEYFQDTHKYRRHIIMDSGNPITITEVLTLFPRYQDIPQLVSYLCYEIIMSVLPHH